MIIKLKNADFTSVSIGEAIILPTVINDSTKDIIALYTHSQIDTNSRRAFCLEWLFNKLKNNDYRNFLDVADCLYIPVFATNVKDCFVDIVGKENLVTEQEWISKCSVSKEGIIPNEDLNGSFVSAYGVSVKKYDRFDYTNKTFFGYSNSDKSVIDYPFCPITACNHNNNAQIGYIRDDNYVFSYPNNDTFTAYMEKVQGTSKGLWANIYPSDGRNQMTGFQGKIKGTANVVNSFTENSSVILKVFCRTQGINYKHPTAPIAINGIFNVAISEEEFNYLNKVFDIFCNLLP